MLSFSLRLLVPAFAAFMMAHSPTFLYQTLNILPSSDILDEFKANVMESLFPLPLSMPKTFLSVVYEGYGSFPHDFPEFQMKEMPPPPECRSSSSVLVKVYAAAINPADYKITLGFVPLPSFIKRLTPPGMDFAGVVASGPREGEAVYGMASFLTQGALSEYICVSEDYIATKPQKLSFVEAASLPLAAQTSYDVLALASFGLSVPRSSVLILGGGSSTGSNAIALAKSSFKFKSISVTASPRSTERAFLLGANDVYDYTRENEPWDEQLMSYGRVFDIVYDTVGGNDVYHKARKVTRVGGRFISVAGDEPEGRLDILKILRIAYSVVERNVRALIDVAKSAVGMECGCCGPNLFYYHHTTPNSRSDVMEIVADLVEKDMLEPNVAAVFDFDAESVLVAMQAVYEGVGGKVVVAIVPETKDSNKDDDTIQKHTEESSNDYIEEAQEERQEDKQEEPKRRTNETGTD